MQKYDYIISGLGASGLMLAYHMVLDPFFDEKQILLIDKELKNQNDRTWCFWEKGIGVWDEIVSKKWDTIYFGSTHFSKQINILPYQYKLVRSKDFYDFIFRILKEKSNITISKEEIISLTDEGNIVRVETNTRIHLADKVFNSVVLSKEYKNQSRYPVLNQHFVGWFVKTQSPLFDIKITTFMDFTVAQKNNTRFMYVLPISETEALFEYTLFSEDLLEEKEYENEIARYVREKGIDEYEVIEKEKGCIPMTCYEFRKHNSKNILHIGTAGGWTKPSTGYTFNISLKKINTLTSYLKSNTDLSKFSKRTKFWYYDLLFLDVLYTENRIGSNLFSRLFQKNKSTKILKFLDEETTLLEDIKITTSLPAGNFLKALYRRFFKLN
ncbi:lycopene beta-cyclase [Aquimarina sp. EL_43]|uniref:lycopene cyclase family protein n=1 Tax=unclassified Aquimarina TaxID=2627091 RepID=UPI0018C97159|nr:MULTISPECIES: lycopene cyclase family protein [unclassified Aquimarina]MBG6132827.1 lycopene beta-cyclase [Aquimarina sp. EL_35]MBG6153096.1 lycopene beta-cyclase [Aquimarina sp. EL_32]MBG6171252.1 lycopene beta-cyclase [Aquimarina sp. EL_43]